MEDIKDAVVKRFIIEAVENHKGLKKGEPAGALSSFAENKIKPDKGLPTRWLELFFRGGSGWIVAL